MVGGGYEYYLSFEANPPQQNNIVGSQVGYISDSGQNRKCEGKYLI